MPTKKITTTGIQGNVGNVNAPLTVTGPTFNIHPPKRDEIEEKIDSLKKSFFASFDADIFSLYVKPLGSYSPGGEAFDVLERINQFLASSHERSLLVLGDSGLGKSLLGRYVVQEAWRNYQPGPCIPLFIHLPLIPKKKRARELLQTYLRLEEQLHEKEISQLLKYFKHSPLLIVLDGYDEIQEAGNLYLQNNWGLNVKCITTCRLEALLQCQTKSAYQSLFSPSKTAMLASHEQLVEVFLNSFTVSQIETYLQRYVSTHSMRASEAFSDWQSYQIVIQELPGLADLVTNPFMLSLVVRVLPTLMSASVLLGSTRAFTRYDIYQQFTQAWFNEQMVRLSTQGNLNHLKKGSLESYLITYAENLALNALQQGRLAVTFEEKTTLHPELLHPLQADQTALHEMNTTKINPEVIEAIRSGCLLKTGKGTFSFLHKTLLEYFAARRLYHDIQHAWRQFIERKDASFDNKAFYLNRQRLNGEPGVIHVLAEMAQQEKDFEAHLFDIVKFSSQEPTIEVAAANAITILNYARFNFSGKDLCGIRVKGADLTRALLHHTDLRGSDLSETSLANAYMTHANLSQATLRDVHWGQEPDLKLPLGKKYDSLGKCLYSLDGQWIVGCSFRYLYVWCADTRTLKYCLSIESITGNELGSLEPITLSFSSDGKKLGIGSLQAKNLAILEIKSGTILKHLSPLDSLGTCADTGFYQGKLWGAYVSAGSITIYEFDTQMIVRSFVYPGDIGNFTLHLAREASWLVGKSSKELAIWDLLPLNLAPVWQLKREYDGPYCLSADGERLAATTSCDDTLSTITVWEMRMQCCLYTFKVHSYVIALAFDAIGRRLASVNRNGALQVWEARANRSQGMFYPKSIRSVCFHTSVCFHPYQARLLSAHEGTIQQWPLAELPSPLLSLASKQQSVGRLSAVDFSSFPVKQAWQNWKERTITFTQAGNLSCVISLRELSGRLYGPGGFSSGGEFYAYVLTNFGKATIGIWKMLPEPAFRNSLSIDKDGWTIMEITLSSTADLLAIRCSDRGRNVVLLWEMASQRLLHEFTLSLRHSPFLCDLRKCLTFSLDGQFLIYDDNGEVWCWERKTFSRTRLLPHVHLEEDYNRSHIVHLFCSPNLRQLVVTFHAGVIEVWDIAAQKREVKIKIYEGYSLTDLSADGNVLMNVREDGSQMTWCRRSTPKGERFILSSDVPSELGFYSEGIDISEVVGLSLKSRLFLEQQGAIGLLQDNPAVESEMNKKNSAQLSGMLTSINPEQKEKTTEKTVIEKDEERNSLALTFLPAYSSQSQPLVSFNESRAVESKGSDNVNEGATGKLALN